MQRDDKRRMCSMGGHIMTLARFEARKAVKEIFRRQGLKVAHIKSNEITKAANAYLLEHPELIDQAAERFRSDPVFMMACTRFG
jgi:hypothetical protein